MKTVTRPAPCRPEVNMGKNPRVTPFPFGQGKAKTENGAWPTFEGRVEIIVDMTRLLYLSVGSF